MLPSPSRPVRFAFAFAAAVVATVPARASVVWTGSGTNVGGSGNSASASATFTIAGNTLTILLQNTSAANTLETPTNTLTGLDFTLNGTDPALTPVSAISPNAILNASDCNAGSLTACSTGPVDVGGEWGYQDGYGSGTEGIASAGYLTTGQTGDIGNFNNGSAGTNLAGPDSLDGIQMGIVSKNHGTLNGGSGGLDSSALIDDNVVLTLTGVSSLTESEIGNVTFLYGTAPDGSIAGSLCTTCGPGSGGGSVPVPGALAIFGSALLLLGWTQTRRIPARA